MLKFFDNMTVGDDKKQPYSITPRQDDIYDDPHGFVDKKGYALTFMGTRFELNVPTVENFNLNFSFNHTEKFCENREEFLGVYFGYDNDFNQGYCLHIIHSDKKGTILRLVKLKFFGEDVIKEQEYPLFKDVDVKYPVTLSVQDGNVKATVADCVFEAQVESVKGHIGFNRKRSFKEIYISDVEFSAEELQPIAEPQTVTAQTPTDDGMLEPYTVRITKTDFPEHISRIQCTLDGGVAKRSYGDVVHGEDCCWTGVYDNITKPYFRINGGKRHYIDNGQITFLEEDYAIQSENNTIWWEVTGVYDTYRSTKKVVEVPYEKTYMVPHVDIETISFGYEEINPFGREFYSGAREFVFDKKGNVLYNGAPIDRDYAVLVQSPLNEELAAKVPTDAYEYDKVIKHFEGNHYFYIHQRPQFTAHLRTTKDTEFLTVKVCLLDAFLRKQKELLTVTPDTFTKEWGADCFTISCELDTLPEGVYHISYEIYHCGQLQYEHHSAFEVLDMASPLSPQQASGMLTAHIGDGGVATLIACPDPWSARADFNMEHYFDIAQLMPFQYAGKGAAALLKLTKRKTHIWLTKRTARSDELHSGAALQLDTVQNADYLNYYWPGITSSVNYYRYDFFYARTFVDDLRALTIEFAKTQLPADDPLLKKDLDAEFGRDDHHYLMSKYGPQLLDYIIPRLREMFKEQWAEVKKLAPNAKRQSYGPWNPYCCSYFGAYSSKWFGGDPTKWDEMFDGFFQFEDYPLNCGYGTHRGAYGIMTTKYLCPNVRLHPELYDAWEEGCPDGALAPAYAPLGVCESPSYFGSTQLSEYVYNTPVLQDDGSYAYWRDYAAMFFNIYMHNPDERFNGLLPRWGVMMDNKPVAPKRSTVFIYDIDKSDDRYNYEIEEAAFFNISDSSEAYLYKHLRESGISAGCMAGFRHLPMLDADNCEMLILPSLKNADAQTFAEIRRLHALGVPLVAVSDVGELTDIFGVTPLPRTLQTTTVYMNGESEHVAPVMVEYKYDATDAQVLLDTNVGAPAVLRKGNALLLNAPISQLGINIAHIAVHYGNENISALLKTCVRDNLRDMATPLYEATAQCGVSAFTTENGDNLLLLVDYGDHNPATLHTRNTQVTVRIREKGFKGAEILMGTNDQIGTHLKNGELDAITVRIKPQESMLIKLS